MFFDLLFCVVLILVVNAAIETHNGNYIMQLQEVPDGDEPTNQQQLIDPQLFDYDNSKNNHNIFEEDTDAEEEHDRNTRKQLHSLCETLTEIIPNVEGGYEFKPLFYTNTTCFSAPDVDPFRHKDHTKEFCYLRAGLARTCLTKFKEFTFFKRKLTEGCWHPEPRLVAIGCDCNVGFKYYH